MAAVNAVSETAVRVRYAETDQMGVVYHSNFFIYFEIGRVEYMRQRGIAYKQMETEDDAFIVVAEAACRYLRPARYDDLLLVRTRVTEVRRRTIRFAYEIAGPSGQLLATGETLHVVCDSKGRPKALPDKYRSHFPPSEQKAGAAAPPPPRRLKPAAGADVFQSGHGLVPRLVLSGQVREQKCPQSQRRAIAERPQFQRVVSARQDQRFRLRSRIPQFADNLL